MLITSLYCFYLLQLSGGLTNYYYLQPISNLEQKNKYMQEFYTIDFEQTDNRTISKTFLETVAPRPIAFVSTIDTNGVNNLAPFSFFNAIGSNPPLLFFSPARRGRDNTTKHTFDNIAQVKQVVVNMVSYNMVEQMNLASAEFEKGVDEFEKSGLTPLKSETVRAMRVAESPVQFECEVTQVIETGNSGGAGNLIICKVLRTHIAKNALASDGKTLDPQKADLVGRMGGNLYVRTKQAIFEVQKPTTEIPMGIDGLPEHIRRSKTLTGNELAKLGMLTRLPQPSRAVQGKSAEEKELIARKLIQQAQPAEALSVLIA